MALAAHGATVSSSPEIVYRRDLKDIMCYKYHHLACLCLKVSIIVTNNYAVDS